MKSFEKNTLYCLFNRICRTNRKKIQCFYKNFHMTRGTLAEPWRDGGLGGNNEVIDPSSCLRRTTPTLADICGLSTGTRNRGMQ